MKKFVGPLILINICLFLVFGSMLLLAETYPFSPGERGYSLQDTSEQLRLHMAANPSRRADYSLALAERRLADLALAGDSRHIERAVSAFDRALNTAIQLVDATLAEAQPEHYARLDVLFNQADIVIAALDPALTVDLLATLDARVQQLQDAESGEDLQALVPQKPKVPAAVGAEMVSFLGISIDHQAFPLESGHSNLKCLACHAEGSYANTDSECQACHALPEPQPALVVYGRNFPEMEPSYPEHFPGECADCHGLANWKPIAFDHATVVECASCHASDIPKLAAAPAQAPSAFVAYSPAVTYVLNGPTEHYPGECQQCHSDTADWQESAFDHAGVRECASCHAAEAPAQHLPGACDNCHANVEDWADAKVNHSGYGECLNCHRNDDPADHYAGLCSNCHSTLAWSEARFSHADSENCRSCHQKPTNHYAGQCESCHKGSEVWDEAVFSHTTRYADCTSCHGNSEPTQHYTQKCSECHSTSEWAAAAYEHTAGTDCRQCHHADGGHYPGQCSNCHNATAWTDSSMDHAGFPDCASCHIAPAQHWGGECSTCHTVLAWDNNVFRHEITADCLLCHPAPDNHYLGNCSNCHELTTWLETSFDHTGYSDCLECHGEDAPANHWPGQCSDCHFITEWADYIFNHTGYTNCNACHQRPSDHSWRGQCSNCHSTDTWVIPTVTPVAALRDISNLIPTAIPLPLDGEEEINATPVPPANRDVLPTTSADDGLPDSR